MSWDRSSNWVVVVLINKGGEFVLDVLEEEKSPCFGDQSTLSVHEGAELTKAKR